MSGVAAILQAAETDIPVAVEVAEEVAPLVVGQSHPETVATVNAIIAFLERLFPGHNVPPPVSEK